MNKEIEQYLKKNELPCTGKGIETKEETKRRLAAYKKGRDFVFHKWIKEQRYKELISVAHAGWFSKEDYLEPLAEHFVKANEPDYLRFLCERDIRFNIKDMLFVMEKYSDEVSSWDEVLEIEVKRFVDDKERIVNYKFSKPPSCYTIETISKKRHEALRNLNRYLGYLEQLNALIDKRYLQTTKELLEKVKSISFRKKDLSLLKYNLKK